MTKEFRDQFLSQLIEDADIHKELRIRKMDVYKESHSNNSSLLQERIAEGWEVDVVLKTKTKISKPKSDSVYFEDKVWALFALLGFKLISKDRHVDIPYDKRDTSQVNRLNLFAKDDESVILVDCMSASENSIQDLDEYLSRIKVAKGGTINSVHSLFPGTKPKIKFILATKNIGISEEDIQSLQALGGIHFSEEVIDYYYQLVNQIGNASRYQLLGALFEGQEIPDLDNLIPAIEGKMGGHTYYSFSIEPEKLLKISYILHRNKAHENMMPTYQRLIKKSRLKDIQSFIDDEKGYFPNSLIINIITDKKRALQFDRSNNQPSDSISRIGILHLPKKYKSAFIIDGQHRLYGYANSQFKSTNSIPVVALINLERAEQIKLFMQINENQKPVSKDLRNTLDADLLWDSDNYIEQIKALKSRIAIHLGENRLSPLYDKISIGEDKKLISTQQISLSLTRSNFLGKVRSREIERPGTFYNGNLQQAFDNLSEYISSSFSYLKRNLPEMWEQEGSIILMNKAFYGIIMILNDIVNNLYSENIVNAFTPVKRIFTLSIPYLESIVSFYKTIDDIKINELKTAYGTPGDVKYWRTLQIYLKSLHDDLHYEGLEEYLKREEKENNERAFKLIRDIESLYLKNNIQTKLEAEFGSRWFKKAVPEKIYIKATTDAAAKNRQIDDEEQQKEPWDQLHLIDYREIILANWQKTFENIYTKPGEKNLPGGKEAKTKWMVDLNRLRNENFHTYYVTNEELSFLEELSDWLKKKVIQG